MRKRAPGERGLRTDRLFSSIQPVQQAQRGGSLALRFLLLLRAGIEDRAAERRRTGALGRMGGIAGGVASGY